MIDINNLPNDNEEVIIYLKSGGKTKATYTTKKPDDGLLDEVVGRFSYMVNSINLKGTIRNNGVDTSGIERWEKIK